MAGRSGPFSVLFNLVFAIPFVAIGGMTLRAGLEKVVAGNGSGFLLMLFGGVFAGAGVRQVIQTLRGTRSAESVAARKQGPKAGADEMPVVAARRPADYRTGAGGNVSAREAYGAALDDAPLPKIELRQGRVLDHALGLERKSLNGELVFALLWNALVLPVFFVSLGHGNGSAGFFMLIFVAVGAFLGFRVVKRLLARQKLARVEIDAEPALLGSSLRIHVEQGGPARVSAFRVNLVCREEVKYTVGTNTRTETHDVIDELLLEDAFEVGLRDRWSRELSAELGPGAPPSFASSNNTVAWLIRVRAEIEGWPDYDETFAFRALPRPPT